MAKKTVRLFYLKNIEIYKHGIKLNLKPNINIKYKR